MKIKSKNNDSTADIWTGFWITKILWPRLIVCQMFFLFGVIAACSTQDAVYDTSVEELVNVVSTVSPITSIVENIGGTKIRLEGIIPEGVNSHTFEPSPSVAKSIANADLIVMNGLFLEEPFLKMAMANKRESAIILSLGDKAISSEFLVFDSSFPESKGHPNPHLWTDPILALSYAKLVRDQLVILDNDNAKYYQNNYDQLKLQIEDLDRRIRLAISTIPIPNRKLLTYHDSFPYFASRYGLEVVGAVQPSDFTEPSAREVARLIDQIKTTGLPAIFGSEVFRSRVMEQIANETGIQFIDQVRDDDLPGSHGDVAHTYAGLMLDNIRIIVSALGGNVDSMSGFDPGVVFTGTSRAKYPE